MRIDSVGMTKIFVKDGLAWPTVLDVDFTVRDGEFVSLLGPSGCGKTTVMNLMAGLLQPTQGELTFDGEPVNGINRRVGYMTQKDSLMPWRTVYNNVRIALELRHIKRRDAADLVDKAITLVGLDGFKKHYPHQLSGGMRKRVLLARTLVYEPPVLLMDEPFGNLDAQLKMILQVELMRIWSTRRPTIVFVTHDIEEAILLSDRIFVFGARPGQIKAVLDVKFDRPRDPLSIKFAPEFGAIYKAAWEILESEYTREESI
jgi:NitT/TauT family transport system ATP-binding protein